MVALLIAGCGGGEAPAPPVRSDDALRYCVMLMSCTDEIVGGAAACVRDVQLILAGGEPAGFIFMDARDIPHQVACAASAESCAAMLDCRGLGRPAGYCADRNGVSCDGEVAVACNREEYPRLAVDCAERGLRCHPLDESAAATCTNGVACDPGPPSCEGSIRMYCVDGMQAPDDCGLVWPGGTCEQEDSFARAACVPSGADCSADRCDGSTLVSCVLGHELPVDCAAAAEGTCVDGADGPQCVPAAAECDPLTPPELCHGDGVRVCVNGRYATIDCREIGLRTCGIQRSGDPECVP